jgi:hypothetical protein
MCTYSCTRKVNEMDAAPHYSGTHRADYVQQTRGIRMCHGMRDESMWGIVIVPKANTIVDTVYR